MSPERFPPTISKPTDIARLMIRFGGIFFEITSSDSRLGRAWQGRRLYRNCNFISAGSRSAPPVGQRLGLRPARRTAGKSPGRLRRPSWPTNKSLSNAQLLRLYNRPSRKISQTSCPVADTDYIRIGWGYSIDQPIVSNHKSTLFTNTQGNIHHVVHGTLVFNRQTIGLIQ